MTVAVVVLNPGGLATARRIVAALPGAELHGLAGRVGEGAAFTETAPHLRGLFADGVAIVGVCAAGILVRALGAALADKGREPPVLAVAEDGSVTVPLLGGHHGANALAREIAGMLGGVAAITTAGDVRFGVALDDPPPGWALANPRDAKPFMAALLAGARVRVTGDAPWLGDLPTADDGALEILVTARAETGGPKRLVFHPRALALGIGAGRGADPAAAVALARKTLSISELSEAAVAGVFSLDLKADEPAVLAVADDLGVPFRFFDAATLEAETLRLANPSETVFRNVGCHGVAEGAALAAAGPEARLLAPKRAESEITCAVAIAPRPIDAAAVGRRRGSLAVVGIGPGSRDGMTGEVRRLIGRATDIVGYQGYTDLVEEAGPIPGKRVHAFAMQTEEDRARAALDLAAEGRDVVLVSAGDAGIYAMASLVFALLDRAPDPAWRTVAVSVAAGVTAMQALAARVGAPLGHDFCAISLSDLLTPWPVIEKRLEAAAAADFVVGLYNPASRKRTWQIERARDILMRGRPAETPVAIGRKLGREGESVAIVPLGALSAAMVDMLSVVVVGSSRTRATGSWIYTPRGYPVEEGGTP